ncbi:MAG: thiamine phosphate synthase [Betaproteobacteria bacterium]|nr:thiamine phosphate synthase [Betaproteobacteria bacterium]
MNKPVSGLYAVTPELTDSIALISKVDAALRGGASVIQYRSKSIADSLRRSQAGEIVRLCRNWNALFIVNDSVALAREVDADGVHLGKDDGGVLAARTMLGPGKLIGVSCYNEIGRAREAVSQGADYVAFGSFFSSSTKPEALRAGTELLQIAASEIALPVVAIGGITENNAAGLIAAGADAVAVVGALFDAIDVEAQARRFARLFQMPVNS